MEGHIKYPYIALRGERLTTPLKLSPAVMRWSDQAWLVDLRPAQTYWEHRLRFGSYDGFGSLLRHSMSKLWAVETGSRPPVVVWASDYWQALLVSLHAYEQGLSGFIDTTEGLGASYLRQISWDNWLRALEELLEKLGLSQAKVRTTYAHASELTLLGPKLGYPRPYEFRVMGETAMARRFNVLLAQIWKASFGPSGALACPWESWQPKELPELSRHWEGLCHAFGHFESLLLEDLFKLATHKEWDQEKGRLRVLTWELKHEDLSLSALQLRFRYPQALRPEAIALRPIMAQAKLQFEEAMTVLKGYQKGLVGWSLKVESFLIKSPRVRLLFHESSDEGDLYSENFQSLANQLPVPMARFDLRPSWWPEKAYCERQEAKEPPKGEDWQPWLKAAHTRPLIIHKKPNPLPGEPPGLKTHLETLEGYWPELGIVGFRKYFRVENPKGEATWAYCDQEQKWFEHGVFD